MEFRQMALMNILARQEETSRDREQTLDTVGEGEGRRN